MSANFFKILLCLNFFILPAFALKHETFTGIAQSNGTIVYTEKHDVTIDDQGKVLEAITTYTDPKGQTLATLKSDFRISLSLPDHTYTDERTKGKYGIRRLNNLIEMFNQDENKTEQKLALKNEDLDRVLIGCQGFNYFLKGELDKMKLNKTLPVLFMVPGDLSTYKFVLEFIHEHPDQIFEFKVKIENWFLRAFAPEFEFKYDKKIERIIWYKGMSNIKDDKGKNQTVEINYKF
jgi:hypothetical protein